MTPASAQPSPAGNGMIIGFAQSGKSSGVAAILQQLYANGQEAVGPAGFSAGGLSVPAWALPQGPAPRRVCARWMGTSPCGAAAAVHVIWDHELRNGPVCPAHDREIQDRGLPFLDRHPYGPHCAAGSQFDATVSTCLPAGEGK